MDAEWFDIEQAIVVVRGQKVMLDSDLARLYGVPVKALNQAVRRNELRFPPDFMFRLSPAEMEFLRSHIVTLEADRRGKHSKYASHAFTEQGVAMLSSVLRSTRAAQVNVEIMRAFVRLRRLLEMNAELASKIAALEKRYDTQFRVVFDAIRKLMAPSTPSKRRIGFRTRES